MSEEITQNNDADIALRVNNLSHRYPAANHNALDEITFSVEQGECFGILGPNGGGKTTLFRILSTMLRPSPASAEGINTNGSLSVMGHDVLTDPAKVRQSLGVVFQSPSLDDQLTSVENLRYHGRFYGLPTVVVNQRIEHWLNFFDLADRRKERVGRFSGGMRRKLEVAKALLHEPRVLLMDEPATGLDPAARRGLWQQLQSLRAETGMTIVFTTHLMDEAEGCDRLAIMAKGKRVAVDTPDALKAQIGGDVITLEPEQPDELDSLAAGITERFGPWQDGDAPVTLDGRIRFEKPNGPHIITEVASAFPNQIRTLTVGRPTLEDVFMHLTGASLTEGDK